MGLVLVWELAGLLEVGQRRPEERPVESRLGRVPVLEVRVQGRVRDLLLGLRTETAGMDGSVISRVSSDDQGELNGGLGRAHGCKVVEMDDGRVGQESEQMLGQGGLATVARSAMERRDRGHVGQPG